MFGWVTLENVFLAGALFFRTMSGYFEPKLLPMGQQLQPKNFPKEKQNFLGISKQKFNT